MTRILVFQHHPSEHPGVFREFLAEDGIAWDAVELDGGEEIPALSGYDALEMATMSGARGLGMADEIGSLEAGKKADVILLDVSRPWLIPIRLENFCSNLVYNANGSDVTDVFVDGNDIVRDREVMTIDRLEVSKQVQRRAERIWARAEKNF